MTVKFSFKYRLRIECAINSYSGKNWNVHLKELRDRRKWSSGISTKSQTSIDWGWELGTSWYRVQSRTTIDVENPFTGSTVIIQFNYWYAQQPFLFLLLFNLYRRGLSFSLNWWTHLMCATDLLKSRHLTLGHIESFIPANSHYTLC